MSLEVADSEAGGPGVTVAAAGAAGEPLDGLRATRGDVAKVDFYSSAPHYAEHMRPIWEVLQSLGRAGEWYTRKPPGPGDRLTVVSSFGNLIDARRSGRRIAYMEHGAGFTYRGGGNPFAGGIDRANVALFLNQNGRVHELNRAAHPDIPGVIVGTPKMDRVFTTPARLRADVPVVALSFHWDYKRLPEARWAYPHYRRAIPELAKKARRFGIELIGHGHPRAQTTLRQVWARAGIPFVASFAKVLETSDLYVVDTSSTAYEYAASGRPVLSMNAPWYRRNIHHGLRFWEHVPGLSVDEPDDLAGAILRALADPPEARAARTAAVERVFPVRDGTSAARAAESLVAVAKALRPLG